MVADGADGAAGTVSITNRREAVQSGLSVLRTLMVYVSSGGRAENTGELTQLVPSMLYSKVAPTGDVTVMVPVCMVHVG